MILRQYYDALSALALGQSLTTVKSNAGSVFTNGVNYSNAHTLLYFYKHMATVTASTSTSGVVFGTGDTPVRVDNYGLSGKLITTISGNGSITKTHDSTNGVTTLFSTFTLSNTGSEDVTIKEVGLQVNYTGNWCFMVDRTVLATPLTIPAGGIGQMTYTIRLNYPTA